MMIKVLPLHEPTVNAFLALPGIRVVGAPRPVAMPIKVNDQVCPAAMVVTYEPAPSAEELQARGVEAALQAQADELVRLGEIRRVAAKACALGKDLLDEYGLLKNAGQRSIWLSARGFSKAEVAVAQDLLVAEMMPTTVKLAGEASQ